LRAVIIGFIKSTRIYSPGSILSSNNYKINIIANKSMKLSVSTLLSAIASPACNGRKTYHKEEYLKFLFKMSIYKKYFNLKGEFYEQKGYFALIQ
jgi:hypothetical protein